MQRSNQLSPVDPASRPALRSSTTQVRWFREICSMASVAGMITLAGIAVSASVVCLAGSGIAHAQGNPQQLAEANRAAMEAYNNLDIEGAKAQLEKAAKGAEKSGIRGPALARTYSNLAVVLVGGLGDMKGATAAFARALKEDPKVEPDPIVATPEVMTAYSAAKSSSKSEPAAEEEEPTPARAPRAPSGPVEGNLDHTPAAEQLAQTAVPVFVKKSEELDIASVKVFYRSLGMKKPKSAEMSETDDGYTYLIPCTDVFEPVVEYFIVATDDDDKTVGNAGTAEAPIAVPIVAERTEPAPSLPGQVAPSQCSSDDECPPGMPGCGSAGLGDTCSADADCASGLVCEDDFCSSGEREASDEDDDESGGSKQRIGKKFFVDLSFGVGLTAVGKGRAPDRNLTVPVLNDAADRSRLPENSLDLDRAERELQARGFDCKPSEDSMQRLQADDCAVAVNPGGIVPVPVIGLALGYYLTPTLAVAVTGRFQIGSGEGPLAGMLLGGRGEYLLTRPTDRGLRVAALAGLGIGQMQARPRADGSRQGPYATHANVGGIGAALTVGARASYRLSKNFGVTLTPAMNFGFPSFLFAIDATAGVELAF
jgi:hypothetical protein